MTAILGRVRSSFALLVMDSSKSTTSADGRTTYDAAARIPFGAFDGGFVAACGRAPVGWGALAALAGAGALSLDEAVARVRPCVADAVEGTEPDRVRSTAVHILTTGSDAVELGVLSADGRFVRCPSGSTFTPPAGTDRETSIARFRAWEGEPPSTGYELFRSVASLFAELAAETPTVSGVLRLGLLQRPPGASWIAAHLVADAAELRTATDARISELLTPCESSSYC